MNISAVVNASIAVAEARLARNLDPLYDPPIENDPGNPPLPDPTSLGGVTCSLLHAEGAKGTFLHDPDGHVPGAGSPRAFDECGTPPGRRFPPPSPWPPLPFNLAALAPELPAHAVAHLGDQIYRPK